MHAGRERPRVHAEKRQLAHEGVVHQLERERRERLGVRGLPRLRLTGLGVDPLHRRDVERRREIVDDGVEERLDALVLEGAPQITGTYFMARVPARTAARRSAGSSFLSSRYMLHQLLIDVGQDLHQMLPVLAHLGRVLGGDWHALELRPEIGVRLRPDQRGLLDQVDNAPEAILRPERQLEDHRDHAEPAPDHVERAR